VIRLTDHERARLADWIVQDLGPLCPPWLARQRWFGGKARPVAGTSVADVVWLGVEQPCSALVLLDVRYGDGPARGDAVERYALVAGATNVKSPSLIAAVPDTPWLLSEVSTSAAAVGDMLGAMCLGQRLRGVRGGELTCQSVIERPLPSDQVRPVGQEQSNTSISIGGRHVLKVIRRLQPGEHPQLEIGAFLARAGFSGAPPLEGSMVYRDAGTTPYAVGILEGWIQNTGDGWQYVTSALEQTASSGDRDALLQSLSALGVVTADFHIAMASDTSDSAFAPEPATAADRSAWVDRVLREAKRTIDILETDAKTLQEPAHHLSLAVVDARSTLRQRIAAIDPERVRGPLLKIRVHGDYHLGQTLKTASGFVLIDFEGEPARPLAERRAKHCALKDVAGMLRSLEYADAAVRLRLPAAPPAAERMRHAFLRGYYSRPQLRSVLPDHDASAPLLMLFELEKVLYEVEYELNNRPDWLPIPLSALARVAEASP
jgi:trehalose synthase-fused probable maltokinase